MLEIVFTILACMLIIMISVPVFMWLILVVAIGIAAIKSTKLRVKQEDK